ncbi:MAG: alpha/beta fold hydrolase [Burkholderiales bacterium]
MPYAKNGDQEIFYEDTGGDLPAIIFSHGLLMDHTMFAPQVDALRDRYRCITWDERGHGRTATDHLAPFSYYDSADDCIAVLRHAGVSRAVLAGMSQGGYLSLRCALRHPDVVRALILIDTQALPEDQEKIHGYQQIMTDWVTNGLSDATAAIIAHIILGDSWAGAEAWKAKWKAMKPVNLLGAFTALGSRDDISTAIAGIRAPALVIHGEADIAIEPQRAEAMRTTLPNAVPMVPVPGAGHAANLTNPAPVNAAIIRFLEGLAA